MWSLSFSTDSLASCHLLLAPSPLPGCDRGEACSSLGVTSLRGGRERNLAGLPSGGLEEREGREEGVTIRLTIQEKRKGVIIGQVRRRGKAAGYHPAGFPWYHLTSEGGGFGNTPVEQQSGGARGPALPKLIIAEVVARVEIVVLFS